jgi:RNA polymerase-binding transcription factor DksA
MDSHYSDEFLAERKADLLRQKGELEQELSAIARFDESAGGWVAIQSEADGGTSEDIDESSGESEEIQEHRASIDALEKTLVEVDHALAKLVSGEYGKCEVSEEWIEEDRLVAYPAARTCSAH